MFLATVFLLGDCIVFFLAEALMPVTIADQVNFASSTLNNVRDSLVIASTTRSSRRKRLAIGFVAVLVSIIFYAIFIAAPWGFVYTTLPRPICEEGKPDHAAVDLGLWQGSHGGWMVIRSARCSACFPLGL